MLLQFFYTIKQFLRPIEILHYFFYLCEILHYFFYVCSLVEFIFALLPQYFYCKTLLIDEQ